MRDVSNCTVLLVEDDVAIREGVRELLELEGFSVRETSNGKEALDFLETQSYPCLILLDLMMPVMDGWSFMEIAYNKLMAEKIPVMIVSAVTDKRRIPEGIAHLPKPINIDALLEHVTANCR